MNVAPSGMSAWRALLSAISLPRAPKKARMVSTMSSSRRSGTAMTSAMASRVMSSWVGPMPPETITASLRARAVRKASTMRSKLSPTLVWKCESIPTRASCSPIQDEFVSTIWPSRSSVPTATTSHRTARRPAVQQVLPAGEEGEHDGEPEERGRRPPVVSGHGPDGQPDGHLLHGRLDLRPPAGGHGDAPPPGVGPVHADRHFPGRDEDDGQPPQPSLDDEDDEGADHE